MQKSYLVKKSCLVKLSSKKMLSGKRKAQRLRKKGARRVGGKCGIMRVLEREGLD